MATVIKNMKGLNKIIEKRIQKALEITQEEIFDTIQEHINTYYTEYSPKKYIRTEMFKLESLIKTKVVNENGKLYCTVEIDPNYLNYTYPGGYATGLGVAMEANRHSHGGIYDDDFGCFWDDAMIELGLENGIKYIMKKNLQRCGVPIK